MIKLSRPLFPKHTACTLKPIWYGVLMIVTITCSQDLPLPPVILHDYFVPGCDKCDCELPCTVNFSNESQNADSFQWHFGDGASSRERTPSHTYTRAGTYKVLLSGRGAGGVVGASIDVIIKEPKLPAAGFTISGEGCIAPCDITFLNTSIDADHFLWHFGDGSTSEEPNPKHTYYNSGEYQVTLDATGWMGRSSSLSKTVLIADQAVPVARFGLARSGLEGYHFQFDNQSDHADTFYWEFGDGHTSTERNPSHRYEWHGNYTVKLTATSGSASASTTLAVLIPLYRLDMIAVEGGSFLMGSNAGSANEQPIHPVTLTSFEIGKTPITVSMYDEFCRNTGHSTPARPNWNGWHHPVVNISWDDAIAFCQWLSYRSGQTYRLPTEAEWEYAARGGRQSSGFDYAGSHQVAEVAWCAGTAEERTYETGLKKSNELGLYDMSGNVWEWCYDWYRDDYYAESPVSNPNGPVSGDVKVVRGGSWNYPCLRSRVAGRGYLSPNGQYDHFGFRVVRVP